MNRCGSFPLLSAIYTIFYNKLCKDCTHWRKQPLLNNQMVNKVLLLLLAPQHIPVPNRSFSHSVTSPTSQLILQPFRRFTYVIAHSPSLPLLHLRHSSFSNYSFASPTSQALHLIHLASRPWKTIIHFGHPTCEIPISVSNSLKNKLQ